MSKKKAARTDQPVVPQVSPALWKELLASADEFNRLAPWTWMHDSQVIGLRHPVTNELLLASILGRMRTVFALLIYRNEAGRRWLMNVILSEGELGEDDDSGFEQDAIKVEYVLKRDMTKEDREVLAAVNYSPPVKGGRVWPQFRSMAPGAYPWHVTQSEAETLAFALPRVAAAARLTRQQPDLWNNHGDGEIAFLSTSFDPAKDELRAEQIDCSPMLPAPEPAPEMVSLDDATIQKLSKLKHTKGFHLEPDLTYSPMVVVAGADRPRFPKLAMAVDRASGFVGGFHLSESNDPEGTRSLGAVMCDSLTKLGALPEIIYVQRPRVGAMLAKVASQLKISVLPDEELAELNAAKAEMEAFFRRR